MYKNITLFVLFTTLAAFAQFTTVTGTFQDPNGQAFVNGTYSISFSPIPGNTGPYKVNGQSFSTGPFNGSLDSTGSFTLTSTLADNSLISPIGTSWQFTICPNASTQCTITNLAVVGASMNISSQINTKIPVIIVQSTLVWPSAYQDPEIKNPINGTAYFNTVSGVPRGYFQGVWSNIPSSGIFNTITVPITSGIACTIGLPPNGDRSVWDPSFCRIGFPLQQVSIPPYHTANEFALDVEGNATSTSFSVTTVTETVGNIVTLTVPNSIVTGSQIAIQGMVTATWLNGQQPTVTTANSTSITFTDSTSHGAYGPAADSGTVAVAAFKGGLFSTVSNSNPASNVSINALTGYVNVQPGNTTTYSEGAVVVVQNQGAGGDGQMIGGEFDVFQSTGTNGTADINCESGPLFGKKCKINLYMGTGSNKNSWFMYGDIGNAGAAGGIEMVNVSPGGPLILGNNTNYVGFLNAAKTVNLQALSINASNQTVLGSTAAPSLIQEPAGLVISPVAPTISSGFGTGPSIINANGTAAFQITIGTGGIATFGNIGLPNAPTGWNCFCNDLTTNTAIVFACKQSAGGTQAIAVIGNYNTTGVLAPWVAGDILNVSCFAR